VRDEFARARAEARSLGDAAVGIGEDIRQLGTKEIGLARAEIADSASAAKRGGVYFAVGALLALYAVGFLALALMYGLDEAMPAWMAAALTGGLLSLGGLVAAWVAMRSLREFSLTPKRTLESVQEDWKWAREQIKRNATSSPNGS
jgi:hypothetical protein